MSLDLGKLVPGRYMLQGIKHALFEGTLKVDPRANAVASQGEVLTDMQIRFRKRNF
jgi:hypothetical protein